MTGGALQLSLYGNQDVLITGAPEVTYFKLVYKRHTHFSSESSQQIFQSSADFGKKAQCPITKSGDLVSKAWLQVTLPPLSDYQFGTPQVPTTTVPAIKTARWVTRSKARISIEPPTQSMAEVEGSTIRYRATLDPPSGINQVYFYSDPGSTTIDIPYLEYETNYTVTVRREQVLNDVVQNSGSESASMPIDSLRWTNAVGHALLKSCELEIGGVKIDTHESDFMDIWSELTLPEEKKQGFYDMIGKYEDYDLYANSFDEERTLFIPLNFFFCKTPGLAIPLVSLAYHNVVLNFEFRDYTELIRSTTPITTLSHVSTGLPPSMDVKLYANFILLDTEERRRFASMPHEYLIEQCQNLGDRPIIVDANNPNLNIKAEINFSHPVKEILWVYNYANSYNSNISTSEYSTLGNDYFNYDLPGDLSTQDPIVDAKIQLNGHDRTVSMPAKYYRLVQPYQHHTRISNKKIYTYSFALHPEDVTPSGTCNFSRVDSAHLVLNLNPAMQTEATKGRLRIFGNSFNVFRVAQGMGGLAFTGS